MRWSVIYKKLNLKKPVYPRESEPYTLTTVTDFSANTSNLVNS